MSAPTPKQSLTGHCSVINNNTLYVLSPNAFQSLPLKENATWSTLPTGESVTGPACVTAWPNGNEADPALYVIGGTSDDDSYGGLQRYFFTNQTWETLTPLTSDMKGRIDHSIAYLNDSSSILVYAGGQQATASASSLSSQTFLISVDEPYQISSFISTAPPASQPILLPWDSSHAVMLGGSDTNEQIFLFGPSKGWQPLDTNLTSPLPTGVRGALMTGSDGSKVLEVYDATQSPNSVTQLVLLEANGKTASNGQTIGGSSSTSSSRKRKRDLTLSNWPDYNSTNAPTAVRSDYSVAQNSDGLAVVSGGNDDDPIDIFNQQKNAWVDDEAVFGSQQPLTSATPTATSSASATSSTAAATSTVPASLAKGTSNHTRKTLGITLGVLAAVAILLTIALLYMRRRQSKKKAERKSMEEEKADEMDFADRGASFMKEAGGSVAELSMMPPPGRQHFANDSQASLAIFAGNYQERAVDSAHSRQANGGLGITNDMATLPPPNAPFHEPKHSSLAILSGKIGNRHSRNENEKGSFDSTARLVRSPSAEARKEHAMEMNEINSSPVLPGKPDAGNDHLDDGAYERPSAEPSPLHVKKRSSGWSKYFAPGVENGYQQANQSALSVSQYTASRNPSALVPPLDFQKDLVDQRVSAVAKGRPSFQHSHEDLAARGASLDSVRPQTAAFHTGNSVERDNYFDRDSFDSRRHSTSSMGSSRIASSIYLGGNEGTNTSAWPGARAQGTKTISVSGGSVREITVSPRIGQLQRDQSNLTFPRPPSSAYSASIAPGRDSRMPLNTDLPGAALSPPLQGPATIPAIPGPAARAAARGTGNSGFFPNHRDELPRPPTRSKLGALHPGTLAAIRADGPQTPDSIKRFNFGGDNRDSNVSNVTVWPGGEDSPSARFLAERERLQKGQDSPVKPNFERDRLERQAREMREKELKEGSGTGDTVMSGISEYSWLNLGAK